MKVIDTDNFDGDYPNEKVVAQNLTLEQAERMCRERNTKHPHDTARYWTIKSDDYVLRGGFEP